MRAPRWIGPSVALLTLALVVGVPAQTTQQGATAGQTVQGAPPQQPQPPPAGRGRGGRGRGAAVMTLSTTAWADGGQIPVKYSQAGDEVSPALTWSNVPEMVQSFVLIVHDVDAATSDGTSAMLHWLVWNIPGSAKSLPEAVPQGAELPDGMRQISQTGPNYRGPAAPASGPPHHYLFELFALDATIDVPAVGASPAETRAAVVAAMAGHVRGKAAMVGLFRRPG